MTHRTARALGLACTLFSSAIATAGARAEEPPPPEASRAAPSRVVHDHRFIPFQVVTWPLVTTRFAAITSAGALWAELHGDNTTTLVTLQENFQFEWAILEWLGVEGHLLGSTASATDASSLIRTGLSYAYGGKLGLVGRFLSRGRFYFSGRIDGEELKFQSFVPARLVGGVSIGRDGVSVGGVSIGRDGPRVDGSRIVERGRLYRVRPSLNLAVGIKRWFGVQASAAVDIDFQSMEHSDDGVYTTLDLGLGGSFDLNQVHVPISILVGGRILHDFGASPPFVAALQPSGQNRGQVELAIYYSGRPGIDLGLATKVDLGSGESSLLVSPVINYVW